ncbi:MAG: polysaccharide pyruvyl transferase family protein [Planctomycetes bacterium]|nr:polysaccharide pyruvyl transferase family protein [Planctomycetota bacterium]
MKIGILTQPLGHNYGGILQNFALQHVLKAAGHVVLTLDLKRKQTWRQRARSAAVRAVTTPLIRRIGDPRARQRMAMQNLRESASRLISTTGPLTAPLRSDALMEFAFDAYIVGSDQVWRPSYSPYLPHYFLDFALETKARRIAYAASFGNAEREFTPAECARFTSLLARFDAVSVREKSAIASCQQLFNRKAELCCDPTLLITADEYRRLWVNCDISPPSQRYGLRYFLDPTPEKCSAHASACRALGLLPISSLPDGPREDFSALTFAPVIAPSVPDWLALIANASFIATDSFHGCVFSLIFRRPFFVFDNPDRGSDRISCLLQTAGLESALLPQGHSVANPECLATAKIDWETSWGKITPLVDASHAFLQRSLV